MQRFKETNESYERIYGLSHIGSLVLTYLVARKFINKKKSNIPIIVLSVLMYDFIGDNINNLLNNKNRETLD